MKGLEQFYRNLFTAGEFFLGRQNGKIASHNLRLFFDPKDGRFFTYYDSRFCSHISELHSITYNREDDMVVIQVPYDREERRVFKQIRDCKIIRSFVRRYHNAKISENDFFAFCNRNGLTGQIIPTMDIIKEKESRCDNYCIKGVYRDFLKIGWREQYIVERANFFNEGREYLKSLLPGIKRAYHANMARFIAGSIPYSIKEDKSWHDVKIENGGLVFTTYDEYTPTGLSFEKHGYESLSDEECAVMMMAVSCILNDMAPEDLVFDKVFWDMQTYRPFMVREEINVDYYICEIKMGCVFGCYYGDAMPYKTFTSFQQRKMTLYD